MSLTRDQEISIAKIKETYAYFTDSVAAGSDPPFDTDLMRRACIIDATSAGTAVIEVEIGKAYANHRGIMHGGAAALVLDQFTSAAFIPLIPMETLRNKTIPPGGVTRSINVTYLRPLPLPATVRVKAKVVQLGRTMAFVRGNLTSKDGRKVYFTCEHHKMTALSPAEAHTTVEARKAKL